MPPTRRIRVAYCLDSFAIGGTELNAVRTVEALDLDRFQLSVVHLQADGPLRARYERLGLDMVHLPIPNLYSLQTVIQGMRLARLLRSWKVDVMHTHDLYCNIFAVPWARLFGKCAVIASRRWWYEAPRSELVTLNRWSYRLAHRVLANSLSVAELLAREEGVSPNKVVDIPNFLAPSAFDVMDNSRRLAQRRAWGLPDEAFAIGIVARLSPVKNHVLLFRATAQLDSRFHLIVIGDGPSRVELARIASQLGIDSRVHFVGEMISPHNLHQFFEISVLCSSSEGFPNSLIEAMAAGRPVIATPVGGMTDVVVDNVTGILVPVDDPAPLIRALRMLAADPRVRNRLGEAGREAVLMRFHQNMVIERLSALYEMLADRRLATAPGMVD